MANLYNNKQKKGLISRATIKKKNISGVMSQSIF